MKRLNMRKFLGMFLAVMLLGFFWCGLMSTHDIKADEEPDMPRFFYGTINNETGVTIYINTTSGGDGFRVYLTKMENAYSPYSYQDGDYFSPSYGLLLADLKNDGREQITYTIEGLAEGKYSFIVTAYNETGYGIRESGGSTCVVNIEAPKKVAAKKKKYNFTKAKVGDTIVFGSYEQDGNMLNGKEDIEWIVLKKTSKSILILSKNVLDGLPYNKEVKTETTWSNCTLRTWLNKVFYKTAFTKNERSMIKTTKVANKDNYEYGTAGGKTTKDKVFLLSIDEISTASYGFVTDPDIYSVSLGFCTARRSAVTAYAKSRLVLEFDQDDYLTKDGERSCWRYWLRSPGGSSAMASFVECTGMIDACGDTVSVDSGWDDYSQERYGIRPAMYIKLK